MVYFTITYLQTIVNVFFGIYAARAKPVKITAALEGESFKAYLSA